MLELYHNNVSVCAQKVRIVLAEKDVPWTNHHLSLAMGEHLTPQFKAMNPRGVVPVLVHAASDRVGDSTQSFGQAMPESSCVIYQKSQKVGLGFRGLRHCHLQKSFDRSGASAAS